MGHHAHRPASPAARRSKPRGPGGTRQPVLEGFQPGGERQARRSLHFVAFPGARGATPFASSRDRPVQQRSRPTAHDRQLLRSLRVPKKPSVLSSRCGDWPMDPPPGRAKAPHRVHDQRAFFTAACRQGSGLEEVFCGSRAARVTKSPAFTLVSAPFPASASAPPGPMVAEVEPAFAFRSTLAPT